MSPDVTNIGDISDKQFANVTKEERKKLIYQIISDEIRFSISDLERIFDKSSRTIKIDLAALKKEGKTKHIGSPANGFYKIIDK